MAFLSLILPETLSFLGSSFATAAGSIMLVSELEARDTGFKIVSQYIYTKFTHQEMYPSDSCRSLPWWKDRGELAGTTGRSVLRSRQQVEAMSYDIRKYF